MESAAERAVLDHALAQGYLDAEQVAAARQHAAAQPGALLPLLRGLIPKRHLTELQEVYHLAASQTLAPPSQQTVGTVAPPSVPGVTTSARREMPAELGGYPIVRELARGGMGAVYVATDPRLGREVAIKVVLTEASRDPGYVERFRREAEATAALHHPNIVAVHGGGVDLGRQYLVMDLIEGESLSQRVRRDGPLDPREAARLTEAIARGMAHAHEKGILHRDMKPANVLVTPDGVPKVTDFGLAKNLAGQSSLTKTGQLMGTPQYMPPEQATGELSQIDERADVYSIGATLFHLLTGRPPFDGPMAMNVVNAVLSTDPPRPTSLRREVPTALESVCLKCLAKEREARYRNAGALADDLARFLAGEPVLGKPPPRGLVRGARRHRLLTLTIGVVVVLGLLALVRFGLGRAADQRRQDRVDSLAGSTVLLGTPTRAAAEEALAAALAVSQDEEADREQQLQALVTRAKAERRLGRDWAPTLGALIALAPEDTRVRRLTAIAAHEDGRLLGALMPFGKAGSGEAEHDIMRARLLWELAQADEADLSVAAAAGSSPRAAYVFLRWGETLLALGQPEEAVRALRQALKADPREPLVIDRLAAALASLGRSREAVELLEPVVPVGDERLIRARLRCEMEAGAEISGLLRSDLAAAANDPEPYGSGDTDPFVRAARARWGASHDDADRARADLLGAKPAITDRILFDQPPAPAIARAARDMAWAYLALGEREAAVDLAAAAQRGLPGDLDTLFLAAELDPEARPTLEAAVRVEASTLEGALGRGLLMRRAAHLRGSEALDQRGRDLLGARAAGDPALFGLLAEDLGDWGGLLPKIPDPLAIPKEDRARAFLAMNDASRFGDRAREVEAANAALKIDPFCDLARHEIARHAKHLEPSAPEHHLHWVRYWQLKPGYAFRMVLRFVEPYTETIERVPSQDVDAILRSGDGPDRWVPWILDRYMGRIHEQVSRIKSSNDIQWSDGRSEDVIEQIDRVLFEDPQLSGLLYVRAHLLALRGAHAEAKGNLDLVKLTWGENVDVSPGRRPMDYWHILYQGWIDAPRDPGAAMEALRKAGDRKQFAWHPPDKEVVRLWLATEPQLDPLRGRAGWEELMADFQR